MRSISTSVAITDPLVKYQSMLATGLCSPDPAQHRLAHHLQKVYRRLKDYSPSIEYRARLNAVTQALDDNKKPTIKDGSTVLASVSHPIRRNPLFARFFSRAEDKDNLALARVLTSHQEAIQVDSPRGLFLSGEVGTGKSMLLDLLADGLPTSRKRRWHFNTFMLYTFSQLEQFRKTQLQSGMDDHYSLMWMAREMIEKSPILFLDEFQLPDRAASKILSNLFTVFFQLGGVLIASSNRMPEELEKATGFQYAPPTTSGFIGQVLGLGAGKTQRGRGELFGSSSDFATFLEVLKARCEFRQMEGGKDWRRREANTTRQIPSKLESSEHEEFAHNTPEEADHIQSGLETEDSEVISTPQNFYLTSQMDDAAFQSEIEDMFPKITCSQPTWEPMKLIVYGRSINISQHCDGVVYWKFADLVSSYGPADYITMASTFHTFIIDQVPVLSILNKNEARRLITLLDGLYEARCKLIVRAAAGPDDLFFPEAKAAVSSKNFSDTDGAQGNNNINTNNTAGTSSNNKNGSNSSDVVDADAIHSETIAEAYQDQMSPFRPNISSYTESNNTSYDPDQDSDFGLEQQQQQEQLRNKGNVDFSNTSAFTGEDERFAYKRAASRLWELCSAQWHGRNEEGWWQPLPLEARHWEGGDGRKGTTTTTTMAAAAQGKGPKPLTSKGQGDVSMGPAVELDQLAGLQGAKVQDLLKRKDEE